MTRRRRRTSPLLRCLQLVGTVAAVYTAGLAIAVTARVLGVR